MATDDEAKTEQEPNAYDEAVDGNPPVKLDITDTVANDEQMSRDERRIEREAREAANDVRRREHSAD
jgi:hypothetical protein